MRQLVNYTLPIAIGLLVGWILYANLHWWVFLLIFPWMGFAITTAMMLRRILPGRQKLLGRKIALLMILPCLLFVVPIANHENLQLEGVVLIVLVGFFSKGFIHYLVAKLLGPLVWRRGFCGYACWTAAVLDWLPIRQRNNDLPRSFRRLRYIALAISVLLPLYLVFAVSYDPFTDYLNRQELAWMFASNGIYYAIAVPLAFALKDRRAFCKYVCPVALVMTPTSRIGLLKIRPPTAARCTSCGSCNRHCPMGVDVMGYMQRNAPVTDTECIQCNDCQVVCPIRGIG